MEPKWLQKKRESASALFAQLPLPVKEETWRHTPIDRIRWNTFQPEPFAKNGGKTGAAAHLLPSPLLLSGEFLYGEVTAPASLDKDCHDQGVILSSLEEAIFSHEALVQKYLGRGFSGRRGKFLAQNEARWQVGAFCYIPKNTAVPAPILIAEKFGKEGASVFPRTLVVLERGAQATVIHHSLSENGSEKNFANVVLEIYLEEGARLDFVDLQNRSYNTYEIALKHADVAANATLNWLVLTQGARLSKTDIESVLSGEGAHAEVFGLVTGSQKQHLELYSHTHHKTPHTTAHILIKSTAKDRAKTIFQGMIKIDKKAQQTESFMANNNLVLSDDARSESIPRLEIEADDVKASHGATVGQVDAEQLFYLKSKGIDQKMAEQLLVTGFYEDVFSRVSSEPIRAMLRKSLGIGQEA